MNIIETENLQFRPLTPDDLDNLATLYADPEVMRFLGGPRSRNDVKNALNSYTREYEIYGHSFFATILKGTGEFIGQCGLLHQEVEGREEIELGYVLARPYWKHGLAIEGLLALRDFGFQQLGLPRIISLIPHENETSLYLAEKIGMSYQRDVEQWGQKFRLYRIERPAKTEA